MADKKNDLRDTLGSFFRSAATQASTVGKIALEQVGQGKERVDDLLLKRKYANVMTQLGRVAFQMNQDGQLAELEQSARGVELISEALELRSQMEDVQEFSEEPAHDATGRVWRPTADTPVYGDDDSQVDDADLEDYMHPDDLK